MRLTDTGLGIGTSSVTSGVKLEVATGNVRISNTNNTASSSTTFWNGDYAGAFIWNKSNTSGTVAGIQFVNGSSANGNTGIGGVAEGASPTLSALAFYTGGSGVSNTVPERMRLTSDGSLILNNAGGDANMYFGGSSGTNRMYLARSGVNSLLVNVETSGALIFGTNGAERARIHSGGQVTIATTDAGQTSGNGIKFLPTGGGASIPTINIVGNSSDSGQGSYHLYSSSLSQYQFYVTYSGNIYARSTSITSISDQTEKTNVRDLETGLNAVMTLKPRRFDWLNGQGSDIAGFIAQEVQTVLPDLVVPYKLSDTETKLGLRMGDMIPTLVKAIQELKAEFDAYKVSHP